MAPERAKRFIAVREEERAQAIAGGVAIVLVGLIGVASGGLDSSLDYDGAVGAGLGAAIGVFLRANMMARAPVGLVNDVVNRRGVALRAGSLGLAIVLGGALVTLWDTRLGFEFAILMLVAALVFVPAERWWIGRLERRTSSVLYREIGWHWAIRLVRVPQEDPAPGQRKLAHAKSAAPRRAP